MSAVWITIGDKHWYADEDNSDLVYGETTTIVNHGGSRDHGAHYRKPGRSKRCENISQAFKQVELWGYRFHGLYPPDERP